MIAVLFELEPVAGKAGAYFDVAAELKPLVAEVDGFLSVERFESVSAPGRYLSLSYWRDEAAIAAWRASEQHRSAQSVGRADIFSRYRIRVAQIVREYGWRREVEEAGK